MKKYIIGLIMGFVLGVVIGGFAVFQWNLDRSIKWAKIGYLLAIRDLQSAETGEYYRAAEFLYILFQEGGVQFSDGGQQIKQDIEKYVKKYKRKK